MAVMEVRVGPVSCASTRAWVKFARDVLAGDRRAAADATGLPHEVVDTFLAYLNTWEAAACEDPFIWTGEVDADQLEYLAHSFLRIVDHLVNEAGRVDATGMPEESYEFYQALVSSIIENLALQGGAESEFSEQLRDRWPGLRGT
jgi:hypothetical protein